MEILEQAVRQFLGEPGPRQLAVIVLDDGRECVELIPEHSRRFNDDHDPEHGPRAAALIHELDPALVPLTPMQLERLTEACRTHTHGTATADPTIGTCWHADRLDRLRVGIRPDPRYLVTAAARAPEVIRAAMERTRRGW